MSATGSIAPEGAEPGPVIRIVDLRVVRGGTAAVDGVSVTIDAGRVTGLLGPSGSGKSTLMRAIVGVQIVTSGSIEILGLPAGSAPLRGRVGYRTQAPSVYRDLTIRDNLRYFARIIGAGDDDVERVIAQTDLRGDADHLVGRLSGGQEARVSLAAALLGDPAVLVLDEPTVGLDPLLRRDLWDLFGALAAAGRTLLVSSHVMDEAARCDRLLLLRGGRVIADDAPAALLARTGTDDLDGAFLALVEGHVG